MVQSSNGFRDLGVSQQVGIGLGILAVLALALLAYLWLYQTRYEPLYQDLNQEDAAKVLAQLQEMKVPYQLADGGSTILVDASELQETRVLLNGGELAIRGGEGFELFDDIDYGMTEFAQKINYQRALQGELSRTIIGLREVRYARVHLVLPEQGLFQADKGTPKASVTITPQAGQSLDSQQIAGIQELVAAAVDGMDPGKVSVLDEQGLVLSSSQFEDDDGMRSRLGQKREMERYLVAKAESVITQVYGYGKAVVNIDVLLSFDEVQLTRETYLPAEGKDATGVLANSRVQRQYPGGGQDGGRSNRNQPASETTEYDYRVGRSVEQVVRSMGTIKRMTVSVLMPDTTSNETVAALWMLVSNAVGLDEDRGDSIQLHTLPVADIAVSSIPAPELIAQPEGELPAPTANAADTARAVPAPMDPQLVVALLASGVILLLGVLLLMRGRGSPAEPALSEEERLRLLGQVRSWLESDPAGAPEKVPGEGQATS